MIEIFVDADACPVKDETYGVAARHGVRVVLVANAALAKPPGLDVLMIVVDEGPDAADDWIVAHLEPGDVVVTTDVPLAARSLARGARALSPTGRVFTEDSIGGALASRELMSQLRESGVATPGPAPLAERDRSRFLSRLDELVSRGLRERPGGR